MKTPLLTLLLLGMLALAPLQPASACAGDGCPWSPYVERAEDLALLAIYIACGAENLGETVQACFNYWYDRVQNLPPSVLGEVQEIIDLVINLYCNVLGDPNRPPCSSR